MFLGTLMIPTTLISGVVYARGYNRAFSIGALTASWATALVLLIGSYTVMGIVIMGVSGDLEELNSYNEEMLGINWTLDLVCKSVLIVHAWFVAACGLIAVAVRWLHTMTVAAAENTSENPPASVWDELPSKSRLLHQSIAEQPNVAAVGDFHST